MTKAKKQSSSPEQMLEKVVKILDEQKAEDILTVELKGRSPLADYMIIASGRSARHIDSLAKYIEEFLKPISSSMRIEGKNNGDWVLVDNGDLIVHLFRPEVREVYNLEKIWVDPDTAVSPDMSEGKSSIKL